MRQVGHADRLLPLRVVTERNRGFAMAALVVNAPSTFAMMLILTYQLQSIMGYSVLKTGLPLVPFALGAVVGSALIAPRLMRRVPPRWLITAAVVVEAAGIVPLISLTPHSGYLPLILLATVVEGIGTGLAGPTTLNTALRGVLPADAGAAGAATSAVGQLGSSVGAALFNTIAATVTATYVAAHPTVSVVSSTVHGFNVAMICGALVLIVAAIPIALFVNAPTPMAKLR
jgi:MFS family permease